MIAHTVTALTEVDPSKVVLKWDVPNGYGNVKRACVAERLRERQLPVTASLFEAKYGRPILVTVRATRTGDTTDWVWISIPESLCQGDDEAPFLAETLFYPALMGILEGKHRLLADGDSDFDDFEEREDTIVMGYIDDMHVVAEPSEAVLASRFLHRELAAVTFCEEGDFVAKFEGYSPQANSRAMVERAFPGLAAVGKRMSPDGMMVMGAPVASPGGTESAGRCASAMTPKHQQTGGCDEGHLAVCRFPLWRDVALPVLGRPLTCRL